MADQVLMLEVSRPAPFGGQLKRSMDILLALAALILAAPALLLVALAVKTDDGGPIFYVQPRVGLGGREFRFLKFRSMSPDADARLAEILRDEPEAAREWREKQKLANDPRVTRIGRILRRSSLDELPQFLNVLRGDMSTVGPRPMLPGQAAEYGAAFSAYCRARPGITGLWQVSGRNETSFRRRSELDQLYLRRWNALSDLVLLMRTVGVVLVGRGAC